MRAEEGDESVKDYAAEGEQTLGKIKASQRAGNRLGDVAKRFARLWRGDHAPRSERDPG
ncbi:hypothetical protein [Mycobacterium scrofulaceum]|uniref:hypothetical protein n=1 Tax=Mycobacterium scrofulaceum TaxID=1783 RepID=UPI00142DC9F8|nr:hypothetical protein [Mycobacterium scrofulaceum]